ncbi:transcriptional regulation of mitochondrial recombination-domain-containing protein [Camillea tinctor]|nr:transcriptional regulation of mitochondrial recombination-domain-containing protein [Camillea tinctor]
MALRLRPIIAQLGRLSSIRASAATGLSRTSIRFNQTTAAAAAATATTSAIPNEPPVVVAAGATAAATAPEVGDVTDATTTTTPAAEPLTPEEIKRQRKQELKAQRKEKKEAKKAAKKARQATKVHPVFAPGHGEKIYVFCHFLHGLTAYSHDPVLKALKALRQISFKGKKLKPAKLRKDYWRPMAMIQFPEGLGLVGRSVFSRLRECKKLHEFSWDDSIFYDPDTKRPWTLKERGQVLNDQKANAVADMAAVLSGIGKGNKIWVPDAAAIAELEAEGKEVAQVAEDDQVEVTKPDGTVGHLIKTQIFWTNEEDRKFAESWPENVSHHLFDEAQLAPIRVGGIGPPESPKSIRKALKAERKRAQSKEAEEPVPREMEQNY